MFGGKQKTSRVDGILLASPRSGTTWLERALNGHPDVFCTEHRFFGDHLDLVRDGDAPQSRVRITLDRYVREAMLSLEPPIPEARRGAYQAGLLQALAETVVRETRRWTEASVYVDKVTPYPGTGELVVRRFAEIWPGAGTILLTRDGRDVLVSGVWHWAKKRIVGEGENPGPDGVSRTPVDGRFFTDQEVREWATLWRDVQLAAAAIPAERRLDVRYEAMLRDQRGELKRILSFLGAGTAPAFLDRCQAQSTFAAMSGGRIQGRAAQGEHVRKGVAGDWRRYVTRGDARIFDEIAGEWLVALGYESDRAGWVGACPERLEAC